MSAVAELVAGDRIHASDRERVVSAIVADADANAGLVNADRVRAALSTAAGDLDVYPRVLSAVYGSLARAGFLAFERWTTNGDHRGGNAGKQAREWRLVRRP